MIGGMRMGCPELVMMLLLVALFVLGPRLNFRGGPPSPLHLLPADDGVLLRSRARKKTGAKRRATPAAHDRD